MTLHIMSDKDLTRLEGLRDLTSGRLTASPVTELLGLERRQVLGLPKAYQEHGATTLISKKRGRASNCRTPADIKTQALELICARYADLLRPWPTVSPEGVRVSSAVIKKRSKSRMTAWPCSQADANFSPENLAKTIRTGAMEVRPAVEDL